MSGFQLDTSGAIDVPYGDCVWAVTCWEDLTPFMQGYVRAAFESARLAIRYETGSSAAEYCDVGFRHLAPATLAVMIADCEDGHDGERGGALFWKMRQRGAFGPNFPPLTLSLGDDGRIQVEVAS